MNLLFFFFTFLLFLTETTSQRILPFSRIKMVQDDIFFSLGLSDSHWHKLFSIDSVGSDAIVTISKQHYGVSKCDYQIKCYKYNIIVNFDTVFSLVQNKPIPDKVGLEYELDNSIQNGIDVESTKEKFENNIKHEAENIKMSLGNENEEDLGIFKGINKLRKSFMSMLQEGIKQKHQIYPTDNADSSSPIIESSTEASPSISNPVGSNLNLRKEISEMKNEIKKLESSEKEIEKNLLQDIKEISSTLTTEKSLIESMWKREIICGLVGALIVFSAFALYYLCNGLLKAHHVRTDKTSIN